MTTEEAIKYANEQLEIFGGLHREFILVSLEALETKNLYETVLNNHNNSKKHSTVESYLKKKLGDRIFDRI